MDWKRLKRNLKARVGIQLDPEEQIAHLEDMLPELDENLQMIQDAIRQMEADPSTSEEMLRLGRDAYEKALKMKEVFLRELETKRQSRGRTPS